MNYLEIKRCFSSSSYSLSPPSPLPYKPALWLIGRGRGLYHFSPMQRKCKGSTQTHNVSKIKPKLIKNQVTIILLVSLPSVQPVLLQCGAIFPGHTHPRAAGPNQGKSSPKAVMLAGLLYGVRIIKA